MVASPLLGVVATDAAPPLSLALGEVRGRLILTPSTRTDISDAGRLRSSRRVVSSREVSSIIMKNSCDRGCDNCETGHALENGVFSVEFKKI